MNKEYQEIIDKLKEGSITEEEAFKLMLDDKGMMYLKRSTKPKVSEDKKKLFIGGTIIGYDEELEAPIHFMPGSHEEALPSYQGIPYMLFHNDNTFPIGKVVEVWFDDNNIKFAAWSQHEEYNDVVRDNLMDSQSLGFVPLDYEFNYDTFMFDIKTYRPDEISGVIFPAYKLAKTEALGETLEDVKEAMTTTTLSTADTSGIDNFITVTDDGKTKFTVTTPASDTEWKVTTEKENAEEIIEMEKLKKENKILKFLAKYPKISNREVLIGLMEKYDLSEEDAEKLITEEVEEEKEVVVEETTKIADNPALPIVQDPIDKDEKAAKDKEMDARVEDSFKRGFGT